MVNTLAPASNGYRGENGRFLKGNAGGPGSPYVKQVAALKASLYEALTPADINAIMQRMLAEAVAGNVPAARLVLEYSVGKPLPGSTASALDGEMMAKLNFDRLTADELASLLALHQKLEGQG